MNFSQREFNIIQDRIIQENNTDHELGETNVLNWELILSMAFYLGFNIKRALANFNRKRLEAGLSEFEIEPIEVRREMHQLYDTLSPEMNSLAKFDQDFAYLTQALVK
jgi:hypothetical protein